MRRKLLKSISLVLAAALLTAGIAGCGNSSAGASSSAGSTGSAGSSSASDVKKTISVGSKGFTESYVISEIISLALEDKGFTVDRQFGISTAPLNEAITTGKLDVYPEYTGTGAVLLGKKPSTDPDEVYKLVRDEYKSKYNVVWLKPSVINNSNCVVIRKDTSDKLGITNLSALQAHAKELKFGDHGGWSERADNLPTMNKLYGDFSFKEIITIDGGLRYEVLANGNIDVTPGFTTDPQLLKKGDFVVLEEDKRVWPPYYLTPVIRQEVLDKYPEAEAILNKIFSSLEYDSFVSLLSRVDIDKEDYETVAKEYFEKNIK